MNNRYETQTPAAKRAYNRKIAATWKTLKLSDYPMVSAKKEEMSYNKLTKWLTKQGYKSNTGRPLREITVNAFIKSCGHTTNPALAWSKKTWTDSTPVGSTADYDVPVTRRPEDATRALLNGDTPAPIFASVDSRHWNRPANVPSSASSLTAIRELLETTMSPTTKLTLIQAVVNV